VDNIEVANCRSDGRLC